MQHSKFHASFCQVSDSCPRTDYDTCKAARILANVYRLWILLPLLDALNFSDDQIRDYRRKAFATTYWDRTLWGTHVLTNNHVTMEDLKTAIHRLEPSDLFREAETLRCLSPRMRHLLGKKLVTAVSTLTPQDDTCAPPNAQERFAALCSCSVTNDEHQLTKTPSTLAGLLYIYSTVCSDDPENRYETIAEALLSRPDFENGEWCLRTEVRTSVIFMEYGLIAAHHCAEMHRQLLRTIEHSPNVINSLFSRRIGRVHLLACIVCACNRHRFRLNRSCRFHQRTEEETCAAHAVLLAIDPHHFVAKCMWVRRACIAEEKDGMPFIRTLHKLWQYCNNKDVLDTTRLGPFVDALFEIFTREELCTEWRDWRDYCWHGDRRTFIWYMAHFNRIFSTHNNYLMDRTSSSTHNYLLDRIVPILLTKVPPEEFLHKVVVVEETTQRHGEVPIPAIFCEICAHCNVETVRAVHLYIKDTMGETGITLTHPTPRDMPYKESNDFVLAALKYNTPDVCAYLWQEARAEDPALAAKCATLWLQKMPDCEACAIIKPAPKSAAVS